jgi:hypothetical protein
MRTATVLGLLALAGAAGLAVAVRSGRLALPPEWDPRAPLSVDAAPNLLTRWKLARLSSDPAACRAVLEASGAAFSPVEPMRTGGGCGWDDAVRIRATGVAYSPPFVLSCPAAVSLALWERHALQPAARAHFGAPVTRIDHLGSYACRNVYGQAEGRRSRHATADALDIAGFRWADGRRVTLLRDWAPPAIPQPPAAQVRAADRAGDRGDAQADDRPDRAPGAAAPRAPAARFLQEARDGACRFFDGVLGPDYNAAHRDHFHLDRGPYRICR